MAIEPEWLMPYLTNAEIERVVHDPANRKLEASRPTSFTGAIRKIIGLRDLHCQHPSGCDEPIDNITGLTDDEGATVHELPIIYCTTDELHAYRKVHHITHQLANQLADQPAA